MIIAVGGPSGAGKTSFVQEAVRRGLASTLPAVTTRARRPGEVPGRDFEFVERDEFRRRIRAGDFTDWDYTIGNYYGYTTHLPRHALADPPVVVAVVARMAVRLRTRFDAVRLVFLDDDEAELQERLSRRHIQPDDLLLRRWHALEEREHAPLFDFRYQGSDALRRVGDVIASAMRSMR